MQPCFVYILGSFATARPHTYVGWTVNLDRRLERHNSGAGARTTRGRAWVLLYAERHATREAAMSREWYLKRDRGFRKRLALDCAGS
jgi:putative endonuclease